MNKLPSRPKNTKLINSITEVFNFAANKDEYFFSFTKQVDFLNELKLLKKSAEAEAREGK